MLAFLKTCSNDFLGSAIEELDPVLVFTADEFEPEPICADITMANY